MKHDPSLILMEDVDGAPVRMGAAVMIVRTEPDDSVSERFLGRVGVVVALVFDDPPMQYPSDPLIQVRVAGVGEDLFFAREIVEVPQGHFVAFGSSSSG
ncbi:Carotenogenesis protein CarS [Corallococcus exiguus]|uniref:Carotenogenesis protein CarS n=1 Tax=Corallococcus TaxID=83461 RepID=UPI000EA2B405|nr:MULTISPECIES: Carotenogenesis protein CarS [Corallococcus]RKI45564.1 Carotenogenesis protein CarS [Corallococcus sp. AB004]NNB94714.1 Carotenogenesis protein CarS [Corallococcus exiguus]NNC16288.1 Carotenogenesis protein CarS [Corallococcus exiguus]NPC69749.1 Carotenogenesis protein CarS [Corallococcus exiguus]NPD24220.1 Carotenogenesis protein CarS [Corallococcus exiguus]